MSLLEELPKGFEDPVECKKNTWSIAAAANTKGSKKWKEKNRVRVGLSTEKPPHTHNTTEWPIIGKAVIKLVITVAPQNDICPQGKTYPKKAAPINKNKITTPTNQVLFIK